MDEDLKHLIEAYKVVLKEFEDDFEDEGEAEDSWWWEEGIGTNNQNNNAKSPHEVDYSSANDIHKNLAPQETRRAFNAYEQCNKLILSCDTRRELIQHFCDIVDGLTDGDTEAQTKLIDMINSVVE